MRKRRGIPPVLILIVAAMVIIFSLMAFRQGSTPESEAKEVVRRFYDLEKKGNYAESWELLHPYMQAKFPKAVFIQDRVHVFMGHFGAETFSYKMSDVKKLADWKPEKGHKPFGAAYRFIVTQQYKGKYGTFSFQQDVYVVEHSKKMRILWDYN